MNRGPLRFGHAAVRVLDPCPPIDEVAGRSKAVLDFVSVPHVQHDPTPVLGLHCFANLLRPVVCHENQLSLNEDLPCPLPSYSASAVSASAAGVARSRSSQALSTMSSSS